MNNREPMPCIEMTKEKIQETVEKFGAAAGRMKRAGMDICLVHGGHGNLISQFTSPLYNHRTDEYGGSLENRARFAIEVCDNIRKKCGENFVIEFRISADEIADEGMHFDETLELIGMLKDHIDIIHVSAGLHSDFNFAYYRNWCQNYLMDRGFNVHYAAKVKERYPDLLVTTVGSITSIEMAEEIIARIERDPLFVFFMSGEKQVIMTGEIEGVPVKIKIDSYHPGKMIVDLKVMKDFRPIYVPEKGRMSWIEAWEYDLQGAVYQEIVRQNTGLKLPFFIAAATKEKEPDIDIIEIPQPYLDVSLEHFKENVIRYDGIKKYGFDPDRCGVCDWCKMTKVLSAPRSLEVLNYE